MAQKLSNTLVLVVTAISLVLYALGKSISGKTTFVIFGNTFSIPSGLATEAFAVFLAVLGGAIAKYVSGICLRQYSVRKILLGSKHVEGHWLLHTRSAEEDFDESNPLMLPGIARITYLVDSQETVVVTTRISPSGATFNTISEVAHIRTSGPFVRYLNFFELSGETYRDRRGFSHGKFVQMAGYGGAPKHLEASIFVEGFRKSYRQEGIRLSDSEVRKFKKETGEKWIETYLTKLIQTDPNYKWVREKMSTVVGTELLTPATDSRQ